MKIAELRAKINLDSTGFKNGVAKAKSSVQSFASSAKKSFVGISRDAISAGAAMLAAFAGISLVKSMVNLGSSAEETADKFNSVFGKAADGMNERLQELKKVIPATTKELQDAVAVFGLMAQSFGLNDQAAEEFSLNMAKIAGDLSSFHDIAPEVAFDKLRAGIAGSSEPLQALGIDIREAALKQEALNIGIYDGVGVLSTSQKAMAIQSAVVLKSEHNELYGADGIINDPVKGLVYSAGKVSVPASSGIGLELDSDSLETHWSYEQSTSIPHTFNFQQGVTR